MLNILGVAVFCLVFYYILESYILCLHGLSICRDMVHNVLFDSIFYGHIISYYFP